MITVGEKLRGANNDNDSSHQVHNKLSRVNTRRYARGSRKWASNQIGGPAKVFEFVKSSKSKPSGLKGSNLIGKIVFTKDNDETEYIVVDEFKDGELLVQKFNEVVGGYGVVLKFSGKRLRDGEEVKKVEKEFKRSYSKGENDDNDASYL